MRTYYTDCRITYFLIMTKIVQATSRGQVTLPKLWRDQFDTSYYVVEVMKDQLVFKPLKKDVTFKEAVEESWQEYKDGEVVSGGDLMDKYGL